MWRPGRKSHKVQFLSLEKLLGNDGYRNMHVKSYCAIKTSQNSYFKVRKLYGATLKTTFLTQNENGTRYKHESGMALVHYVCLKVNTVVLRVY